MYLLYSIHNLDKQSNMCETFNEKHTHTHTHTHTHHELLQQLAVLQSGKSLILYAYSVVAHCLEGFQCVNKNHVCHKS